ncbi:MAG: hypothetical protein JSW56_15350, partial [Deltaproteobacteria bacterium]
LQRISIPIRALFMASGFLIFHPSNLTDLIGLGLVGVAILFHYLMKAIVAKRVQANQETPLVPHQEK